MFVYLVLCSCIWFCVRVFGFVFVYLVLCSCIWFCVRVFDFVFVYLVLCSCIWFCVRVLHLWATVVFFACSHKLWMLVPSVILTVTALTTNNGYNQLYFAYYT